MSCQASLNARAVSATWAALTPFDGNYPVVGAWIVGDEPAGVGIREDKSRVTKNLSRFVPHAIVG